VSISSTFYEQLLLVQILKAPKKDSQVISHFELLGSTPRKAERKLVGEIELKRERESGKKKRQIVRERVK